MLIGGCSADDAKEDVRGRVEYRGCDDDAFLEFVTAMRVSVPASNHLRQVVTAFLYGR